MALRARLDPAAWMLVVLVAWLLWPVPLSPPVSQDHTVHLTRAYLVGQQLAHGHVSGWSSAWYFGVPVGELYPVLGDLAVAALHGITAGLLDWPHAYATVFAFAVLASAHALLATSRAVGWGTAPGLLAAVALLLDPGAPREGGFAFTVTFGVWLQPLSSSWATLGIACVWRAQRDAAIDARWLARGGLWLAAALLSHPAAMPMLAVLGVALLAVGSPRRTRAAVVLGCGAALGVGLAAWWLLPLVAGRAAMANFGTLHLPLSELAPALARGHFAANMPAALGYAALGGMVALALRRDRFGMLLALASLSLWLLAASDSMTVLRLDRVASGFGALQYQRLLIAAKPGVMLCAGWAAVALTRAARTRWRAGASTSARAIALALTAALAWLGVDVVAAARSGGVGEIQRARAGDSAAAQAFERDWADYLAWARARWQAREGFWRFAYETVSRHGHGFADAPVFTGAPAYKLGYTPGETFVHRLDTDDEAVLDRLRVRYLVTVTERRGTEVARFGVLRVLERPVVAGIASLRGPGTVVVHHDGTEGADGEPRDVVEIELRGTTAAGELQFNLAGHERWELRHEGVVVPWTEVPITDGHRTEPGYGDSARPDEPILIAAPAADGRWTLRYRRWLPADIAGAMASAVALAFALLLLRRPLPLAHALERAAATLPKLTLPLLGAVALGLALRRELDGIARERDRLSARLHGDDDAIVDGLAWDMVRVDRAIVPAVVLHHGARGSVTLSLPSAPPEPLQGWIALEDRDVGRVRGNARLTLQLRRGAGPWRTIGEVTLRPVGGRQDWSLPWRGALPESAAPGDAAEPIALQAVVQSTLQGKATLAFELVLAAP